MSEEKKTLRIQKDDIEAVKEGNDEEVQTAIQEGNVEKAQTLITEDNVRDEIDNNPFLLNLRILLNNQDFINATNGRITKETIVQKYMDGGVQSTEVDITEIINITTGIIKSVSNELNGFVFNFDGTTNEKLSSEQRLEMDEELKGKMTAEDVIKVFQLNKEQYELYKNIINSKSIDLEDAKTIKNISDSTGMEENDVKKLIAKIEEYKTYTDVGTTREKEFMQKGFEISASSDRNDQLKMLEEMKKLYKGEDFEEKYAKMVIDKNGEITIDSIKGFIEDWSYKRNYSDIAEKYLEFSKKSTTNFQDIEKLRDKQRLIELIYRANRTQDKETAEWATNLVEKFGLTKQLYDVNGKISNEYVKEMYRSLLPETISDKDLEKKLDNSNFDVRNMGATIKNFEDMKEFLREGDVQNYENITYLRAAISAINQSKVFENLTPEQRAEFSKKSAITFDKNDYDTFIEFDKIDFSKEENKLRFILAYMRFNKNNESNSRTEQHKGIEEKEVMEKYMIYNPQYFGKFIRKYDKVDLKEMQVALKDMERFGISDKDKVCNDIEEIVKKGLEVENNNEKVVVSGGNVIATLVEDEEYTFLESEKDVKFLKLCYQLEEVSEKEKSRILKQIEEVYKNTKYGNDVKVNENGKITLDTVRKFTRKWENKRNSQDIGVKLLEFSDKVKKGEKFDNLTRKDKQRLIETLWRANDPENKYATKMAEKIAKDFGLTKLFDKEGKLSDDFIKNTYGSFLNERLSNKELEKELDRSEFDVNNPEKSIKELETIEEAMKINGGSKNENARQTKKRIKIAIEKNRIAELTEVEKRERAIEISNKENAIFGELDKSKEDFSKTINQLRFMAMYKYICDTNEKYKNNEAVSRQERYTVFKQKEIIKKYILLNPQYFGQFINNCNEIDIPEGKEIEYRNYKNILDKIDVVKVERGLIDRGINPNSRVNVFDTFIENVKEDENYTFIETQTDKDLMINCYKLLKAFKERATEEERSKILEEINRLSKESKYKNNIKRSIDGKITEKDVQQFRIRWEKRRNNQDIESKIEEFNNNFDGKTFNDLGLEDKQRLIEVVWRANDPQRIEKNKKVEELAQKFGLKKYIFKEDVISDELIKKMYNRVFGKNKLRDIEIEAMLNRGEYNVKNIEEVLKDIDRMQVLKNSEGKIEKDDIKDYKKWLKALGKITGQQKPREVVPAEQGTCPGDKDISEETRANKLKENITGKLIEIVKETTKVAKETAVNIFNGMKDLVDKVKKLPAGTESNNIQSYTPETADTVENNNNVQKRSSLIAESMVVAEEEMVQKMNALGEDRRQSNVKPVQNQEKRETAGSTYGNGQR